MLYLDLIPNYWSNNIKLNFILIYKLYQNIYYTWTLRTEHNASKVEKNMWNEIQNIMNDIFLMHYFL